MKNKVIKFILSFTDYQKVLSDSKELKKENKQLNDDIYTLIEKPGSADALFIIIRYEARKELDDLFWFGDTGIKETGFVGITNNQTF